MAARKPSLVTPALKSTGTPLYRPEAARINRDDVALVGATSDVVIAGLDPAIRSVTAEPS
jgi:hypothetical protein